MARLLGFRLSSNLHFEAGAVSFLRQDVLATIATGIFPYQPSLSYIASAGLLSGMVELGAGVSVAHLIPMFGDEYVSLKKDLNMYLTNVVEDTVADTLIHADTNYYTFRGTKLMARVSYDPKRAWAPNGDFGIFGPNDLRLYCETAILGVRNYPFNRDSSAGYTNRLERWPVMVGVNLPVFNVLDVLAIEIEYFNSKIANDFECHLDPRLPLSRKVGSGRDSKQDDVKWTVYASRDIGRFVALHAMIASDHTRGFAEDKRAIGTEEILRRSGDWHYLLRVVFKF
jgi:hypothetical protein